MIGLNDDLVESLNYSHKATEVVSERNVPLGECVKIYLFVHELSYFLS
jgi:hypothetical protein